jgi:hypothetical protein
MGGTAADIEAAASAAAVLLLLALAAAVPFLPLLTWPRGWDDSGVLPLKWPLLPLLELLPLLPLRVGRALWCLL